MSDEMNGEIGTINGVVFVESAPTCHCDGTGIYFINYFDLSHAVAHHTETGYSDRWVTEKHPCSCGRPEQWTRIIYGPEGSARAYL